MVVEMRTKNKGIRIMAYEVAQQIAAQIGHRAFVMMGTQHKIADELSLTFNVRGSRTWNKVKVTLNPMDTYDITFYKIGRAPKFRIQEKTVDNVYVGDMHELIERETGLYLSLGTMGR